MYWATKKIVYFTTSLFMLATYFTNMFDNSHQHRGMKDKCKDNVNNQFGNINILQSTNMIPPISIWSKCVYIKPGNILYSLWSFIYIPNQEIHWYGLMSKDNGSFIMWFMCLIVACCVTKNGNIRLASSAII